MADESMPMPDMGEKDILEPETEIPVPIDSLQADGVRPEVGDEVTIKIGGKVTRIENDCCYVSPETVNDSDLNEILAQHPSQDEDSAMEQMTRSADQMGTPMGGGY